MWYAKRVKKNPQLSITYEEDKIARQQLPGHDNTAVSMTSSHTVILWLLLASMVLIIYGVIKWEWYIGEIAAVFLALGILAGLAAKAGPSEISEQFIAGAKDMLSTALVVGLARAIVVLATDGKIIDTMLYALASPLAGLPSLFCAYAMFVVQIVVNFFVGSGTGQAALTIPIMAPLGDLVGITRQTTVLIYQFGNGFTDMSVPTSAVLVGSLGMAGIPWGKWVKVMLPLQIIFLILCLLMITPAVFMHWGGV